MQKGWVGDRAAEGWLALNINAHDLPIDESPQFYTAQNAGPLKDYPAIGNDDRETSYFPNKVNFLIVLLPLLIGGRLALARLTVRSRTIPGSVRLADLRGVPLKVLRLLEDPVVGQRPVPLAFDIGGLGQH